MGAGAVNIIMLPTLLIPVTWFPDHKGLVSQICPNLQPAILGRQVLGIVTSGFGLSSTVFSPLQTLLINPSNLPPLRVKLIQLYSALITQPLNQSQNPVCPDLLTTVHCL